MVKLVYIVILSCILPCMALESPTRGEVLSYVKTRCNNYLEPEINVNNISAIIQVESTFKNGAISPKDAVGLMQITKPAYLDMIRDHPDLRKYKYESLRWNWKANIDFGIAYFRYCLKHTETTRAAFSAYFWGPWSRKVTATYANKVIRAKMMYN